MAQAYWEKKRILGDINPGFDVKKQSKTCLSRYFCVHFKAYCVKTGVLWKYAMYKISPYINNIHTRHFIR